MLLGWIERDWNAAEDSEAQKAKESTNLQIADEIRADMQNFRAQSTGARSSVVSFLQATYN